MSTDIHQNSQKPAIAGGGAFGTLPAAVTIRDVTLRDGLQSLRALLPTASKVELYDALVTAGVKDLQVTSFVNPVRVPQLADAESLVAALFGRPGSRSVLVANLRGFERAVVAGATEIEAVVSLSETYNGKNAHRSVRQSLDEIRAMAAQSREQGIVLAVALANCYHCVFEGAIALARPQAAISELHDYGFHKVMLCDTTGYATPSQVYELSMNARASFPGIDFGAHLHDTRGRGVANAVAALLAGITWFDAALSGLGGSPFAPGMGGNLSLESLTDTLSEMGIETGIDVHGIAEVGKLIRTLVNLAEDRSQIPAQLFRREDSSEGLR
jgi:hydroxymethylglutaryl-CoA lyase